jgi:hypothetical protein
MRFRRRDQLASESGQTLRLASTTVGNVSTTIPSGTYSFRETCQDYLHPGPPYRTGGPFKKWHYLSNESTMQSGGIELNGNPPYGNWKANVHGHLPGSGYKPSVKLGWSYAQFVSSDPGGDPSSYGAKAWNKFKPTRPKAGLGQFIGEIHEVPRMLSTTARAFHNTWRAMGGNRTNFGPKAVADNWLNTQFGWLPFLSDLRRLYKTTKNLRQSLEQIRRDNGRWVRRRGSVTVDGDSVNCGAGVEGSPPQPAISTVFYQPSPRGQTNGIRTVSRNVWFSGAFRYWIPDIPGSWRWNLKAYNMLYDFMPSPSLVWELTPWSWLIDWCADIGDVLSNISTNDNLCARYAYLMQTYTIRAEISGSSYYNSASSSGTWFAELVSKTRVPASPFGFGLTLGDFTPRQLSILAALGVSKRW